MAKKEMTYAQAICNALDQEMERDDNIVQLGEDIGFIGGNFKCTVGLLEKYGDLRVKDTPISEQGFVGMGVGMALTGLRPVIELMFSDFLLVAGDQVFNQMTKIRYMSGGQCNVPMTIRCPIGAGRSSAAQHSQSIQAMAAHFPGAKVVLPSTATEAAGLLKLSETMTLSSSLSTRWFTTQNSKLKKMWILSRSARQGSQEKVRTSLS